MLQFPTVVQRHQEILTEHTEVSFELGTINNSLVTQRLTINTFFQLTEKTQSVDDHTSLVFMCIKEGG